VGNNKKKCLKKLWKIKIKLRETTKKCLKNCGFLRRNLITPSDLAAAEERELVLLIRVYWIEIS
jgi:hypothetical protein